jgi:glycosyltransferase 2 family protein
LISRRATVTYLFYGLVIIFVAWYVTRLDWRGLADLAFRYPPFVLATLLALAFRYCGVVTWLQILKGLGARNIANTGELSHVYAKSWLGRYLPGKVTWILGKVYFASQLGIPKRELAVGSLFEGALQVTIVLFLSLSLLAIDPRLDVFTPGQRSLLVLGSVALLLLMLPAVFNRVVAFLYRRTRWQVFPVSAGIDYRTLVTAFGLNALGFALSGLGYFFFTKAIYGELGYEHVYFVAGAFNLAGAVGILSFFAPSGLGVRESIQLILLPLVMPAEVALLVTVAARVWSLSVDLLFFGVSWLHRRVAMEVRFRTRSDSHQIP